MNDRHSPVPNRRREPCNVGDHATTHSDYKISASRAETSQGTQDRLNRRESLELLTFPDDNCFHNETSLLKKHLHITRD
jgi:hypothetical protein